jgi:hypothetical protein
MTQVRIEDTIDAPAAAVWDIVRDFGGVQRWSPPDVRCELEGSGVGAVRTITSDAFTIRERLESFDEAGRTLSYAITDSPIPMRNYLATMVVAADGPQRTRLTWSSTFEPAGMPEEQLRQLIETIYRNGIAGLRRALGVEGRGL